MTIQIKPSIKDFEGDLETISKLPDNAEVSLEPRLVSLMTGKALKTLERDRSERKGIPFVRISYNRVIYSLIDVRKFLRANRVETRESKEYESMEKS